MDTSAIVVNKLLSDRDLDIWAKLKLSFLDPAYSGIYAAISRYYEKYGTIPTWEDLELSSSRENQTQKTLAAVKLLDTSEISGEVALDALIDQYTQNETIKLLDKFVDKLPVYDTVEIKDNLASIVLALDEKTLTTEGVYNMDGIFLFKHREEIMKDRVYLGLNNTFDSALSGMALQEVLFIGGIRGTGKSIISNNIFVNQYEAGNSCVYFSIEMNGHETFERTMSIGANVDYQRLKQGKLTPDEVLKLVKYRASMFSEAEDLVEDFTKHRDQYKFEEYLIRYKKLKEDNQLVIIDDRALSLTSLDLHLGKLKARFGDKLKVGVVDYLNQIVIEGGGSQFDWQPQVIISKKIKELARKYNMVLVSPYQIDASGEARFAKGILDAADIALTLKAHSKEDNAISFDTAKIRGGADMHFTSPINWDTLRISPIAIDTPADKEPIKKAGNRKTKSEKVDDSHGDVPWNT